MGEGRGAGGAWGGRADCEGDAPTAEGGSGAGGAGSGGAVAEGGSGPPGRLAAFKGARSIRITVCPVLTVKLSSLGS